MDECKPLGDGSHFRDFIHVTDIARGLVMAYQNPLARGVSVNLGSGSACQTLPATSSTRICTFFF